MVLPYLQSDKLSSTFVFELGLFTKTVSGCSEEYSKQYWKVNNRNEPGVFWDLNLNRQHDFLNMLTCCSSHRFFWHVKSANQATSHNYSQLYTSCVTKWPNCCSVFQTIATSSLVFISQSPVFLAHPSGIDIFCILVFFPLLPSLMFFFLLLHSFSPPWSHVAWSAGLPCCWQDHQIPWVCLCKRNHNEMNQCLPKKALPFKRLTTFSLFSKAFLQHFG